MGVRSARCMTWKEYKMYQDIIFPKQSLDFIGYGGVIIVSVLFVIAFLLVMRYSAKLMPGLFGLLFYLVIVYVGTEIVTMVLSFIPGLNGVLFGNSLMFCLTRAVIMALLLHLGRFIVLKISARYDDFALGDAMMGGFGIALGQTIVAGMDLIYLSTLGTTVNEYGMEYLLTDMTAEEIATVMQSVEKTISLPSIFFLLKGINIAADVIFSVAAAVIVYAVLKKGLDTYWYAISVGLNVLVIFTGLAGDYEVTAEYLWVTILKLTFVAVMAMMVLRVDRQYLNGELRSFDKLRTRGDKNKKMPKVGNTRNK